MLRFNHMEITVPKGHLEAHLGDDGVLHHRPLGELLHPHTGLGREEEGREFLRPSIIAQKGKKAGP